MKAPEICRYTNWKTEVKRLNVPSLKLVDEILDLLENIEKINDDAWFLWLNTERGTFSEYQKSKHYNADIETQETFFEYYPDEIVWIPLLAVKNDYVKYIRVSSLAISIEKEPYIQDSFCEDYVSLLHWVKESVQKAIEELKNNTYNENVRKNLPYEQRYGTINRKLFWQYYPNDKANSLENLTENEINEFLSIVENESDDYVPTNPIQNMTFNKYFAIAYECFKSFGYDIDEDIFHTFERYGEDFGGGIFYEINLNSEQDFDDVYSEKKVGGGGHPWGILRGSSRTRIMLYSQKVDTGYIFRFVGNPNWSIREIVKGYITLKKINTPVFFNNKNDSIRYLREEDLVGFVPITRLPVYCQCEFNEKVDDFRQYWNGDYSKIKNLIKWQEIDEVKLK